MRPKALPVLLIALIAASILRAGLMMPNDVDHARFEPGVAVVEVFTSAWGHDCAAAEAEVSRAVWLQSGHDNRVYALAFHVNDRDAPKRADPFAQRRHAQRHLLYALKARSPTLHTPQVVVNGRPISAAYTAQPLSRRIKKALAAEPEVALTVEAAFSNDPKNVIVTFDATDAPRAALINVALVHEGTTPRAKPRSKVPTVLAFASLDLAAQRKGALQIPFPDYLERDEAAIVAYVQDGTTLAVLGATRVGFVLPATER